jgi:uncharacterized protein
MSGAKETFDLWFARGVRFDCIRCGKCCRGEPGYVWVAAEEITLMAEHLKMSRAVFVRQHVRREGLRLSLKERRGGDCVLWHSRCTVYEARPKQCRTFPFWKEALHAKRAFDAMHRNCPGVGRGKLYTCEEILAIAQGQKDT